MLEPVTSPDLSPPLKVKLVHLGAVIVPFLGLIAAIVMLWGIALDWIHLVLLAVLYVITTVGIGVGYHRYFTHRSFRTPRFMQAILAAMGSMAVEGSVLGWVADHRKHHQHSDSEHDPHSPHAYGSGVWATIRGMLHAHMGWFIRPRPSKLDRYIQDIKDDKLIRFMSATFPIWVIIGLLVPAVIAGLMTMSWRGALLGFIWGGLVRVFLVHHITWSINSVCHVWGTRPFRSHDESRNNAIFGVLALGEGWHNNHHAFPTSARHGLRWWELDVSWIIIWTLSKIGLASDVRVPSAARIAAKRVDDHD